MCNAQTESVIELMRIRPENISKKIRYTYTQKVNPLSLYSETIGQTLVHRVSELKKQNIKATVKVFDYDVRKN